MNVYIKQLRGSAICRLASKPRGNSTVQCLQCNSSAIKTQHRTTEKIHCFSPTPQRDTTECHIQSSPHTMSAPVTPLEEGIFGVGHITQACCNQTPSQLPMFKKSQLGRPGFLLPFHICTCDLATGYSILLSNYWQMLAAVISSLQLAKVIYVVTTYTCIISSLLI